MVYNKIVCDNSLDDCLQYEEVFSYWKNSISKPDYTNYHIVETDAKIIVTGFITPKQVISSKLKLSSAPGPDNLTLRYSNKFTSRQKTKLFTLWLILGWVTDFILASRTIFIPKENLVKTPAKLRPITISSVLLRHFHKVLANRLINLLHFNENQFGFLRIDGIKHAIDNINNLF